MNLLIKSARLFDAENFENVQKDIYIKDGVIKSISENLTVPDVQILDANGYIAVPGFIDMNCNICEPGFENKEDIVTASESAARGGFTSITCQPNTQPAIDNKSVLEYMISRSKISSCVNIYPYGSMTKQCAGEEMAEIGDMVFAGAIAISDGGQCVKDTKLLRNIFKYSKMFNIPIIQHCQNIDLTTNGVVNEGIMSTILGVRGIPHEAEELEIAKSLILSESLNCKLHISSISTKGSVQLIREAKMRGVNVTCDTSPHYFALTEKAVDGYNTFAKVNPPLRTEQDRQAICDGIKDGTIDAISSGHMPTAIESKYMEFDKAEFGISSLETTFSICYTELVKKNIISLPQLIQKISLNPSRILQLNKGKLVEGIEADITIADIDDRYEIDESLFASKAKFTPFNGYEIAGKIVHTIASGKQIF